MDASEPEGNPPGRSAVETLFTVAAVPDLNDLRHHALLAAEHRAERDAAIWSLREQGRSWGELADASGMTRAGVKRVYDRRSRSGASDLVSIGYEGRTLDDFLDILTELEVATVADVRLTPVSRKPGFSKSRLGEALSERGMRYEHLRGLGNPKANREPFRAGTTASRRAYAAAVNETGTEDLERLRGLLGPCRVALLCFERQHTDCHRSCVADLLVDLDPKLNVLTA
jgi:hypothetical protein